MIIVHAAIAQVVSALAVVKVSTLVFPGSNPTRGQHLIFFLHVVRFGLGQAKRRESRLGLGLPGVRYLTGLSSSFSICPV